MKDYYKILGVDRSATFEQLKAAFRKLAMEEHPDRGGSTDKMAEVNEAYNVLGDEAKRKLYDDGLDPLERPIGEEADEVFRNLLRSQLDQDDDPLVNPVLTIRRSVDATLREVAAKLQSLRRADKVLHNKRRRFKPSKGQETCLAHEVIDELLETVAAGIRAGERAKLMHGELVKRLAQLEYDTAPDVVEETTVGSVIAQGFAKMLAGGGERSP